MRLILGGTTPTPTAYGLIGVQAPPELVGVHTDLAGATPPEVEPAAIAGAPAPRRESTGPA